jgi:tetratricopeptide (TPR) repeat protein
MTSRPADNYLRWSYADFQLEEGREFVAAAAEYRRLVRAWPHWDRGYEKLGVALGATGDLQAAVNCELEAIRRNPGNYAAHYNAALDRQRMGDTDAAIAHYRRVLDLRPGHELAGNNLAVLFHARGETGKAVEVCRRALHFRPDSWRLHHTMGVFLGAQGKRNEAIQELRKSLELNRENRAAQRELARLQAAGQFR